MSKEARKNVIFGDISTKTQIIFGENVDKVNKFDKI